MLTVRLRSPCGLKFSWTKNALTQALDVRLEAVLVAGRVQQVGGGKRAPVPAWPKSDGCSPGCSVKNEKVLKVPVLRVERGDAARPERARIPALLVERHVLRVPAEGQVVVAAGLEQVGRLEIGHPAPAVVLAG